MEKEFVNYKMALALKELGFDEPCFTYYYSIVGVIKNNIILDIYDGFTYANTVKNEYEPILAPTYYQAFRWFREKHNIHSNIKCVNTMSNNHFRFEIEVNGEILACTNRIDSFEKAEIACLLKFIEMFKNK
jgi:hypothetical protein